MEPFMLIARVMESVRTLIYDDKTHGRRVITFPPPLPFFEHSNELLSSLPSGEAKDNLLKVAGADNVFKRAELFAEYLGTSAEPHKEILRAAALAVSGETAGLKLVYAALLAVPPAEHLVMELAEFRNVRRVMARIAAREKAGTPLRESEDWFRKKVLLLSISHPLPGASNAPSNAPWLGWSEEVRRGVSDPDRRWDKAVLERAKAELEARELRIRLLLTNIDFLSKGRTTIYLMTTGEETRWRIQALDEAYQRFGEATLVIRHRLGAAWEPVMEALRTTSSGGAVADLFDVQAARAHSYPSMKTGTSVIRALLMHPLLLRVQRKPDFLSCLSIYAGAAGKGVLEILLQKLAAVNVLKMLLDLPGFDLHERILAIDLSKVPPAPFVDIEDMPRDVDWANVHKESAVSWRTLVLTYMDNDNFIVELINNPRVAAQPGIIPLIAQKSRSARVLNIIANTRSLYSGFSNKEVPVNLLMNPAKVPLSALRKFVHVRFMDKASLARLASKGSTIREDIRREVQHYLSSLK
ncbi:MAG: hypothetical protein C4574_00190 [Candidatus Latescibacterota bacterium]|nr:MAG: hypothetical protein C4574_00190 [Candidatus Latescibacterota bacterium]